MKRFVSVDQMITAHELMFGAAGRTCAELVLRWAPILFAVPLDPLVIRVVLAPVELGPYNRHTGYHYSDGSEAFILANRHHIGLNLEILDQQDIEDFIVHEMTHMRQHQLLKQHGFRVNGSRGVHRDEGWYTAIAEACPNYLGYELPRSSWPTGPRTRSGTVTETDMTHWPMAIRKLAVSGDVRLRPCRPHNKQQFMCNEPDAMSPIG